MHPNNVRSSCPTTLIFTTCTTAHPLFQTPTPCKGGKKDTCIRASQKLLTHHPQPRLPIPKTHPTCGARVSRFTRNNGRLGALQPRKKTTSHKGLGGLRSSILARQKKAFAALAPGSWSWVASGIAQFWNLMQERSHGALTF